MLTRHSLIGPVASHMGSRTTWPSLMSASWRRPKAVLRWQKWTNENQAEKTIRRSPAVHLPGLQSCHHQFNSVPPPCVQLEESTDEVQDKYSCTFSRTFKPAYLHGGPWPELSSDWPPWKMGALILSFSCQIPLDSEDCTFHWKLSCGIKTSSRERFLGGYSPVNQGNGQQNFVVQNPGLNLH